MNARAMEWLVKEVMGMADEACLRSPRKPAPFVV